MSLFGQDRPHSLRSLVVLPTKTKPAGNTDGLYLFAGYDAEAEQLMDRAAVVFANTDGIAPALTAYILGIGSAYR